MWTIDSTRFFRSIWFFWRMLGSTGNAKYPTFSRLHKIIVVMITVCYPLHLSLGVLHVKTMVEGIKAASFCVIIVACVMKYFYCAVRQHKIQQIEQILRELDGRIKANDEQSDFQRYAQSLDKVIKLYLCTYWAAFIFSHLPVLFAKKRILIFPGWFPFDWSDTDMNYSIALAYQTIGLYFLAAMNSVNDICPTVLLCLQSMHFRLLGKRLSKLGYDCDDKLENERELIRCIVDHKRLYEMFDILQGLLYWPVFVQFTVAALNMCSALALCNLADELIDLLFYFVTFGCIVLEVFPTCYYGSHLDCTLERLHYDIFCSNWTEQSRTFKQHMIIYTERSLKPTIAVAGGFFRINLQFFIATTKMAYSLYALVLTMKN